MIRQRISLYDAFEILGVWEVAFDSDHRQLLSLMLRCQQRSRGAQHQPKLDQAYLRVDECNKNREYGWTPRAKEFERTWEDKNPKEPYALPR
ncbi:hypothetical protein RB195_021864 [Necator americanus]|uniref:Uncharacterized protein n=1 Tax=Necator americanus TaxID=51031 RepID=A0ABR1ECZ6_NECAM